MPNPKGVLRDSAYDLGYKYCSTCNVWIPPPNEDIIYHECGKRIRTRPYHNTVGKQHLVSRVMR